MLRFLQSLRRLCIIFKVKVALLGKKKPNKPTSIACLKQPLMTVIIQQ